MDKFDVEILSDQVTDGVRHLSFKTCDAVCSSQIDVEVSDGIIRSVNYTKGCHGNTQGIAALCRGMKVEDVVERLEGINCKGRGTSCPDQLARALKKVFPEECAFSHDNSK